MTNLTLAQASGGGASVGQVAIVAACTTLLTLLTMWVISAYRGGGAARLRRLEGALERTLASRRVRG